MCHGSFECKEEIRLPLQESRGRMGWKGWEAVGGRGQVRRGRALPPVGTAGEQCSVSGHVRSGLTCLQLHRRGHMWVVLNYTLKTLSTLKSCTSNFGC